MAMSDIVYQQGIWINEAPDGVRLVVGLTATVQIEPRSRRLAN
jgi:hypothetical protein